MAMRVPVAPPILTLPDGATPERWNGEVLSIPKPDSTNSSVWEALCQRMMVNIHRNHMMTPEEKEQHLRILDLPIPGEPLGRKLSVVEDPSGVYAVGATGSILWPAALTMIDKLDKLVPAGSTNMRVVELGAGLGSVGSFLRLHKGCHVVLTDVTESIPLLQRNVDENFHGEDGPEVFPLRWGDEPQLGVLTCSGQYDLVIGTDITYRPEHIDDLMSSISVLLRPGGRIHISLQDRPGEADSLRQAVERSQLHIISSEEAPLLKSGVEKGSALEEGFENWGNQGDPDQTSRIFIFELEIKEQADLAVASSLAAVPFPGLPTGPDEVEAEFFRMTGIKPDSSLRPIYKDVDAIKAESPPQPDISLFMPSSSSSSKASSIVGKDAASTKRTQLGARSVELKDRIVREYLDRGLGMLLCDMDEDVKEAFEAKRKEDQPRSDEQKRKFAEDFYRQRDEDASKCPAVSTPDLGGYSATPVDADCTCGSGADTSVSPKGPKSVEKPGVPSSDKGQERRAVVRHCVPGLEWDVSISEEAKQLSAIVTFSEEVWEALQVSSTSSGSKSFRDAVSFELSEQELRVAYMDSPVLELCLPQTVVPAAAAAKLSSKLRRVTVHVPLG
jgi:SAM-dependent methyltransferase